MPLPILVGVSTSVITLLRTSVACLMVIGLFLQMGVKGVRRSEGLLYFHVGHKFGFLLKPETLYILLPALLCRTFTSAIGPGQKKAAFTTVLFFLLPSFCLLLFSFLVSWANTVSVSECAHCRTFFCVCVWLYANDCLRTSDVVCGYQRRCTEICNSFLRCVVISREYLRVTTPSRMQRCAPQIPLNGIWKGVRTSVTISRYSR